MKEYLINEDEKKYLISVIKYTKDEYLRAIYKREEIATFEQMNNIEDSDFFATSIELETQFYKDELLRFAKPFLTRKEFNLFKKAVLNAEKIEDFKRFLHDNKNYEYKILRKVIKKIGGLLTDE